MLEANKKQFPQEAFLQKYVDQSLDVKRKLSKATNKIY